MTTNNSAASSAPVFDPADLQAQAYGLFDSSAVWLQTNWLRILVALGVGAVIVVVLFWLRSLGARLARRSRTGKGWSAVLGNTIERTNSFFIVTLSAKLVQGYAGAPGEVATTVNFLFTIAATFQAAIWARELILGAIEHRTASEHYSGEALVNAMGLIRLLVTFALFAVALVVVLDNLGVNVTGLVAGLGVGGIAIGLAAQGIFGDLFAALAIIFDRPFRRGDSISYDQTDGTVETIGLKSTRIRGINGEERIISNKNLLDKEIHNNTTRDRRRIKFTLGLAYETPPEKLRTVPDMLKALVEAQGLVFVRSGFVNFGASTLDVELQFDSPQADFQHAYDARHALGVAIVEKFNAEGLVFAFPSQTTYTAAPDGTLVMPYATPERPASPPT